MKYMSKGEKYLKTIEMIFMILAILVVLIFFSGKLYEFVGEKIATVLPKIFAGLIVLIAFIGGIKFVLGIYNGTYANRSEKVWQKVVSGARNKVILYLKKNKDSLQMIEVLQLMEIYKSDEEIFGKLLDEAIRMYERGDELTKSAISLVLLENESHNKVALLFENNLELKKQCEEISKGNSAAIRGSFSDLQEEVNEKKLTSFFRKLLHSCLPNNSISKEEIVEALEFISGWILKNVSKENIDSHQESILIFMLLLPALKNKLGKNSINSENIVKGLAEIENSDWFKYMLCKAYKCIEFGLCENATFLRANAKWLNYSDIIRIYYEKLSVGQKVKMLHKVRGMQRKLYKEYDVGQVVVYVILASPIRIVKSSDDLLYSWLSLIYLCTSSLKIGEI